MSAPKPEYTVTWREKGKRQQEGPFTDFLQAEGRARTLSREHRTPILIETVVRRICARWENDTQTLARVLHLEIGSDL